MKKYILLILTFFLLTLGIFGDNPAVADSSKEQGKAAVQEKSLEAIPSEKKPAAPASVLQRSELPAEKTAAAPSQPEAPPGQPGRDKDSPASTPSENKQAAPAQPEAAQETAKSPVDVSKSNETALKAIERNVSLFKDRLRERFSIWLERSARYMEIMREVLREKELPEELVFLPIIESGFNLNAYSRAKAVGPWQFIASTAKRYGLVIDWWRDERKDPVKSTKAAAEYLKDLYKMFGSWNLALAAYNAGEGKIMKAMKRSNTNDYWALLGTRQIHKETKEYVPQYIAAARIANTPEEYGFNNLDYHEPLEYDEVTLTSPMDIAVIAHCAEATAKEIRELNPELRRWSTPPNVAQYTIRIPSGSTDLFLKNMASVPKEDLFSVDTYTAKKGDTVKKIAKKTGMPVNAILALNSITGIERIDAGEEIRIPPKDKFFLDLDDKSVVQKVSYKKKSQSAKKEKIGKRGSGGKKGKGKGQRKAQKAQKSKGKVRTKRA